MRNFESISIKEKILVVCQVIAGEKIQILARKHGVSRPSIYAWTQKASGTLEQVLKPGKRGPKFRKGKVDAKDKVIEEQKEKNHSFLMRTVQKIRRAVNPTLG